MNNAIPTNNTKAIYLCECCGGRTLRGGGYEICHRCGWEEDSGAHPDDEMTANHMSLNQGRRNFQETGNYNRHCSSQCRDRQCPKEHHFNDEDFFTLVKYWRITPAYHGCEGMED